MHPTLRSRRSSPYPTDGFDTLTPTSATNRMLSATPVGISIPDTVIRHKAGAATRGNPGSEWCVDSRPLSDGLNDYNSNNQLSMVGRQRQREIIDQRVFDHYECNGIGRCLEDEYNTVGHMQGNVPSLYGNSGNSIMDTPHQYSFASSAIASAQRVRRSGETGKRSQEGPGAPTSEYYEYRDSTTVEKSLETRSGIHRSDGVEGGEICQVMVWNVCHNVF